MFTGARYRLLARLVLDGVTEDWAPVKMVDTFKGMAPELFEGIDAATRQGRALLEGRDASVALPAAGVDAGEVIERFSAEINTRFGTTGTTRNLAKAGLHPPAGTRIESLSAVRAVLDPISGYLLRGVADPDQQMLSDARLAAYEETLDAAKLNDVATEREAALLEVEFIAIYW